MKWNSIAAVLLVFCSMIRVSAQSSDNGQFWIPTDVKWQRVPGAPRAEKKRVASTVILYFGHDREFVRDECWMIRDGESILISNGDPHIQYVGRTEPILDGLQIRYRLVRRTVEKRGEVLPGPEISGTASTLAKSGLEIGGRFFRPIKPANGSDYVETYHSLIRQYAH